MSTVAEPERVVLTPTCPICKTPIAYVGCPHESPDPCPHMHGYTPSSMLEREVFRCYAHYPDLYGRSAWARWRIFGHLFCSQGNGYEWIGGQLVDPHDDEPAESIRIMTLDDQIRDLHEWQRERGIRVDSDEETRRRIVAEREQIACRPAYFYELTERSALANVPDNVQPDWYRAVWHMLSMITYVPWTSVGERGSNFLYAAEIANDLMQRFGRGVEEIKNGHL